MKNDSRIFLIIIFGFISLIILIVIGVLFFMRLKKKHEAYISKKGIHGIATLLNVKTTGNDVKDTPEIEMQLEISIPGKEPYIIEHITTCSPMSLNGLQHRSQMKVLVDPKNRKKIIFENDAEEL